MNTTKNILQAIFISLNLLGFAYISYRFLSVKNPTFRLFGFAMALLALLELCILGVSMLWTIPVIDFKSAQYIFYIYAILMLFGVSASTLKQKTKYFFNIFLLFAALIITGIFFINPNLNNATAYTINYYLSFDNPATVNMFSLALALSLGMAALTVGQKISDKTLRIATEAGYLVLIVCLVINLIIYSDVIRLGASILQLISILVLAFFYSSRKLTITTKK